MTGEDDIARVTPMEQMRGREGNIVLVNGQVHPTLHAQPQDRERWRIINACTSRYVKLALDEHTWELLGKDSGRYPKPRVMADVLLPPGQRADVLVTAQAGTAILRAVTVDRGRLSPTMGGPNASSPGLPPRDVPLATFAVSGTAANPMPPVPRQTPLRDLRAEPITAKRELVFGMQMGGMRRSAPSEHPQPQNRHPMYWATPLSNGILELNGQELTISAAITPDATNIIDALGLEITHECEPTRKSRGYRI